MPVRINENEQKSHYFFILVPVYNVEKYIRKCIESVLNQTRQNFKLILVDDGSPDRSGDICEEYAAKDDRIIVIHQKNQGQIAARQTAVRRVQELSNNEDDIVLYLDSDDSLKPFAIERIENALTEYDCDIVMYGMERVSEGKTVTPYDKSSGIEGVIEDKRELYNLVFNDFQYNPVCRKAVPVRLLSDTDYSDYFHISHGEDLLQSIWYYKHSKKVYFINDSLYLYTVNPSSITQSVTEKNFKVDFTVRQKVHEFLLSENVFTEEDWVRYRGTCGNLIADMILTIMLFPISRQEKKTFFSQIYTSEFYCNYLKGKKYDRKSFGKKMILYLLFQKRIYWPLYLTGDLYRFIKR